MTAAAIAAQVVDIQNDRQHKGFIKVTLHVAAERGAALTEVLGWPTYTDPVSVGLARLNIGAVAPNAGGGMAAGHSSQAASRSNSGVATPVREGKDKAAPSESSRNPQDRMFLYSVSLPRRGDFRRWLEIQSKMDDVDENEAAAYVRTTTRVKTRSEIREDNEAGKRMAFIVSSFHAWLKAPEAGA